MKIYYWNKLSPVEKQKMLQRPMKDQNEKLMQLVTQIISAVKNHGDRAVRDLTQKFDRILLNDFTVDTNISRVDTAVKKAISVAHKNIRTVCEQTLSQNKTISVCDGVQVSRQIHPVEKVGLYVPGGTAPLISTLLMLAIPAQVAGCKQIIVCSPPNQSGKIDSNLRYAARACGIKAIFSIGGAQAIAAMAYGTESTAKVDKIFGPGNRYVTAAKQLVANDPQGATIDMPAGPSELLVIADKTANAQFVAADLLSQLEHGPDSQVLLIATSFELANKVTTIVNRMQQAAARTEIIEQSLGNSCVMMVDDVSTAIEISNQYAPEHLIVQCANPEQYQAQISNAGTVFLGPWASESMGDYITGSNHVLPTAGYARSVSGLSVNDFVKTISFQSVSKKALQKLGPYVETLASVEGLQAHKNAISCRLQEEVCDV